jgi:hypothetical protein
VYKVKVIVPHLTVRGFAWNRSAHSSVSAVISFYACRAFRHFQSRFRGQPDQSGDAGGRPHVNPVAEIARAIFENGPAIYNAFAKMLRKARAYAFSGSKRSRLRKAQRASHDIEVHPYRDLSDADP